MKKIFLFVIMFLTVDNVFSQLIKHAFGDKAPLEINLITVKKAAASCQIKHPGQDDTGVKFDTVRLEQKPAEQTQQHQVISSAGRYFENSSGSISFTLGEPVIMTLSQGDNILTQGFHQSEITVIPVYIHPALQFEIMVYPNPAHDYVIIKADQITGLYYILYTIKGEAIQQNKLVKDQMEIDFSNLLPSIYFLKVIEGNKELKTFKIIKE